ncbi:MAG: hypothetical protein AAF529_06190 [Pseudomonadota bacterium]
MVSPVTITRMGDAPLITADLHPSIGANIQGPSLLKVPNWVANPLGRYYLYFADHKGAYIRLAFADDIAGPWRIHVPGSLQLAESHFLTSPPEVSEVQAQAVREAFAQRGIEIEHDPVEEVTTPHIASPDMHVDHARQQIVMYYHGLEGLGRQVTRVATSVDGLAFTAQPQILGHTYWRAFTWDGDHYALAMPGQFYRSQDPFTGFVAGPQLFNPDMRHNAVLVRGSWLYIFWTQVGDAPEHIKLSRVDLHQPWTDWQVQDTHEVLRPERDYEGAGAPLLPSRRSTAYGVVNQLRDPCVYVEGKDVYLLYAVGGEAGIALARVEFHDKQESL